MLVEDNAEGAEEIADGGACTDCVGAVALDVDCEFVWVKSLKDRGNK